MNTVTTRFLLFSEAKACRVGAGSAKVASVNVVTRGCITEAKAGAGLRLEVLAHDGARSEEGVALGSTTTGAGHAASPRLAASSSLHPIKLVMDHAPGGANLEPYPSRMLSPNAFAPFARASRRARASRSDSARGGAIRAP